uniref:Uncharacterized protein n=1 Tax=Meloidogyne enterolobii TaxID=390850 RepID=A0A6V7VF37_MELEN|nr:unnamed protein product [Meloidogyne enterolobii]
MYEKCSNNYLFRLITPSPSEKLKLESGLYLDPDLDFSWIQSPDQGIFQRSLIFP